MKAVIRVALNIYRYMTNVHYLNQFRQYSLGDPIQVQYGGGEMTQSLQHQTGVISLPIEQAVNPRLGSLVKRGDNNGGKDRNNHR